MMRVRVKVAYEDLPQYLENEINNKLDQLYEDNPNVNIIDIKLSRSNGNVYSKGNMAVIMYSDEPSSTKISLKK